MLINDNHNWYLLISRDEKSGIAERREDRLVNKHTHLYVCVIKVLELSFHLCLCTFLTLGWSQSNQAALLHHCVRICVRVFSCI